MKKRLFYKSLIYFLTILLITSSILPGLANKAEAATPEAFLNPLLEDWLPQPGQPPGFSSGFSAISGETGANGAEPPSFFGSNDFASLPETPPIEAEPVDLPKGSLSLVKDDFILPSYGFPITIQRLYKTEKKDKLSPFGYGWAFPYDHTIQMFADFNIAEFKPDGSQVNYTYHKDDDTLL
ncbi:hypothetical protein CU635_20005, partial [Bacillus canaveralius]